MKQKQKQKKIKLDTALTILDEVLTEKGYSAARLPLWKTPPATVIKQLDEASENGEITYNKASKILEEARTSKMPKGANAGMEEIKQKWRKSYIDDTA